MKNISDIIIFFAEADSFPYMFIENNLFIRASSIGYTG